jgi:hypothetical protein
MIERQIGLAVATINSRKRDGRAYSEVEADLDALREALAKLDN